MSKKNYRSKTSTAGRNMAGARALWRATGFTDEDFKKPIIAIANSFTQFVPGHVHLHPIGQMVKQAIAEAGGVGVEFNTIAVDDGIAMGHDGMLYSLPSRDLIADSVEYMVNAHQADALFCISNCDKITPGMLMATMRLNIPTIFVSGGPMEAGVVRDGVKVDLIDAMVAAGNPAVSDSEVAEMEENACPTCGSCSGMFTANSMNCLNEAIGLALPGNGTIVATHEARRQLFLDAAHRIVAMAKEHYEEGRQEVLPREIANRTAFHNAMALDVAMGGSTNTVLHILAIAREGGIEFDLKDIDELSRKVPTLCKVAPNSHYHIEDVHRAGGIMAIMHELLRAGKVDGQARNVLGLTLDETVKQYDITKLDPESPRYKLFEAAPAGVRSATAFSQQSRFETLDKDRAAGCVREAEHAFSADGGLCVLYGNIAPEGCVVKTAGVDESVLTFEGRARIFHSQDAACDAILGDEIQAGDVVVIRYEGPRGGPGMQEMLYPTSYIKAKGLGKACALITDGRFSGGTSGLSIGHVSPEAAAGGPVGLLAEGDPILIDIPNRKIEVLVSKEELAGRRERELAKPEPFHPGPRERQVSQALRAYALMTTSASRGAVRDLDQIQVKRD